MIPARWRSPSVILFCGSAILMLSLGTRQTFGLFMQPMTSDLAWGREVFAFALGVLAAILCIPIDERAVAENMGSDSIFRTLPSKNGV